MNWKRSRFGALLIALASVALAGCGGDGGSPAPQMTINGVASKGPIEGATVIAYKLSADGTKVKIGEATTVTAAEATAAKPKGSYSLQVSPTTGSVLIEVSGKTGAKYKDEATQRDVLLGEGFKFRTAVPDISAVPAVAVTPLTEVAVRLMEQSGEGFTLEVIKSGNYLVEKALGISDIVGTLPVDITAPAATATLEQKQYGLVLGGLSQYSKTLNGADTNLSLTGSIAQITNLLVTNISNNATTGAVGTGIGAGVTQILTATVGGVLVNNTGLTATSAAVLSVNSQIALAVDQPIELPDFSDVTAPTAPAALAATVEAGAVALSWTAATDDVAVTVYYIYRNGVKIDTSATTSYTDNFVTPGTAYAYAVKAVDAALNASAESNVVSVSVPGVTQIGIDASGTVQ